ncbi:MAG: insulinase family protein, partial [Gemmatimonadetes bacterium]|nr:insulinase family protein [Gemmatimonadota bacterium]
GGGSEGRLFRLLREQKGWTYGAYSSLSRPVDTGVLTASADVRTEVTDSALVEFLTQMRRMGDEPVGTQELQDAKGYLVGSFPLQIETPQQVASQVAITRVLGLPMDALLGYRERISAVTAADVQRVARKYLTPDRAAIVVVGDAPKILAGMRRVAPVTLVSVEGQPIDPASLEVRASTERFDASKLQPGTQTYQVSMQGNAVGTQTVTLAREGSNWLSTSALQIGPVRQSRTTRWTADFTPVSLEDKAEGQLTAEAAVQLTAGRIRGNTNFPPAPGQPGQARTLDVAAVQGLAFEGQNDAMISVANLAPGKALSLPVFNANRGALSTYSYRVTGAESVQVPAGTFAAFRVEMTGGQVPMTVWYRQDAPHIPLKYELQGVPLVITLSSMR